MPSRKRSRSLSSYSSSSSQGRDGSASSSKRKSSSSSSPSPAPRKKKDAGKKSADRSKEPEKEAGKQKAAGKKEKAASKKPKLGKEFNIAGKWVMTDSKSGDKFKYYWTQSDKTSFAGQQSGAGEIEHGIIDGDEVSWQVANIKCTGRLASDSKLVDGKYFNKDSGEKLGSFTGVCEDINVTGKWVMTDSEIGEKFEYLWTRNAHGSFTGEKVGAAPITNGVIDGFDLSWEVGHIRCTGRLASATKLVDGRYVDKESGKQVGSFTGECQAEPGQNKSKPDKKAEAIEIDLENEKPQKEKPAKAKKVKEAVGEQAAQQQLGSRARNSLNASLPGSGAANSNGQKPVAVPSPPPAPGAQLTLSSTDTLQPRLSTCNSQDQAEPREEDKEVKLQRGLDSLKEMLADRAKEQMAATDDARVLEIETDMEILRGLVREKELEIVKESARRKEEALNEERVRLQAVLNERKRQQELEEARKKEEEEERERRRQQELEEKQRELERQREWQAAAEKLRMEAEIREPYTLPPPEADPPCDLPLWCVIPRPQDIETPVEVARLNAGSQSLLKRVWLGRRGWALFGRRDAAGPMPDIGLAAVRASRKHAVLLRNYLGKVFLMDLGSPNGTFMNKVKLQPLTPIEWTVGTIVWFGEPKPEIFELRVVK